MSEATSSENNPIIIDLGKNKSKDIKKLRKGKGQLMDKIGDCIEELKTAKEIDSKAQIVIVLVKEKDDKNWFI